MYSLSYLTRNLELPDPKRANFALRSEEVAEGVVYELAGETLAKVGLPHSLISWQIFLFFITKPILT